MAEERAKAERELALKKEEEELKMRELESLRQQFNESPKDIKETP